MSPIRKAVVAALISCDPISDSTGWQGHFCFPETSYVFAGHFPGHPVLPAVVQLHMVEVVLEHNAQFKRLRHIKQAKFLAPLLPGEEIHLTIKASRRTGCWDCQLSSAAKTASSFQLEMVAS